MDIYFTFIMLCGKIYLVLIESVPNEMKYFRFSVIFVGGNPFEPNSIGEQTPSKWANNEEIEIFREYLRIPTVQPNVNYSKMKQINQMINFVHSEVI